MENISAFCRIKMRVDVNREGLFILDFITNARSSNNGRTSLQTQQNAISVMSLQYCRRKLNDYGQ